MKKVIVIAGPTASGKSSFAIELAHLLDAEVISGDSIQVYKGCNIGSGKLTEKEMEGIPHHLIDILSPKEAYSAMDFQKMARSIIDNSNKLQIICGGTGLYLKSCLYDYTFPEEKEMDYPELDQLSNDALYQKLMRVDPIQAAKIHPHNRRRVLRSLSIYMSTGKKQSEIEAEQEHKPIYDAFIAGCTMDRQVLYERINQRVEQMFKDGLVNEVEGLLKQGVTFDDHSMKGIGYHEFKAYFEHQADLEQVKQEIQKHSRQFAKRQYTWFNHQMDVHWFNSLNEKERENMKLQIRQWAGEYEN